MPFGYDGLSPHLPSSFTTLRHWFYAAAFSPDATSLMPPPLAYFDAYIVISRHLSIYRLRRHDARLTPPRFRG